MTKESKEPTGGRTDYSVPKGRYLRIVINVDKEQEKARFCDLNRRLQKVGLGGEVNG